MAEGNDVVKTTCHRLLFYLTGSSCQIKKYSVQDLTVAQWNSAADAVRCPPLFLEMCSDFGNGAQASKQWSREQKRLCFKIPSPIRAWGICGGYDCVFPEEAPAHRSSPRQC